MKTYNAHCNIRKILETYTDSIFYVEKRYVYNPKPEYADRLMDYDPFYVRLEITKFKVNFEKQEIIPLEWIPYNCNEKNDFKPKESFPIDNYLMFSEHEGIPCSWTFMPFDYQQDFEYFEELLKEKPSSYEHDALNYGLLKDEIIITRRHQIEDLSYYLKNRKKDIFKPKEPKQDISNQELENMIYKYKHWCDDCPHNDFEESCGPRFEKCEAKKAELAQKIKALAKELNS
jgi:hypothetical protein